MEKFIRDTREDINREIQLIEREESNIFQKSINIISLLETTFDKLKEFVSNYSFESQSAEITFFPSYNSCVSIPAFFALCRV